MGGEIIKAIVAAFRSENCIVCLGQVSIYDLFVFFIGKLLENELLKDFIRHYSSFFARVITFKVAISRI